MSQATENEHAVLSELLEVNRQKEALAKKLAPVVGIVDNLKVIGEILAQSPNAPPETRSELIKQISQIELEFAARLDLMGDTFRLSRPEERGDQFWFERLGIGVTWADVLEPHPDWGRQMGYLRERITLRIEELRVESDSLKQTFEIVQRMIPPETNTDPKTNPKKSKKETATACHTRAYQQFADAVSRSQGVLRMTSTAEAVWQWLLDREEERTPSHRETWCNYVRRYMRVTVAASHQSTG